MHPDSIHLAALAWVETFLWLVFAVVVLSAITLVVAWANDRWARRGADADHEQHTPTSHARDFRERFDPTGLQD